jgi:hypothetical protein
MPNRRLKAAREGLGVVEAVLEGDIDDALIGFEQLMRRFGQAAAHQIIIRRGTESPVEDAAKMEQRIRHRRGDTATDDIALEVSLNGSPPGSWPPHST